MCISVSVSGHSSLPTIYFQGDSNKYLEKFIIGQKMFSGQTASETPLQRSRNPQSDKIVLSMSSYTSYNTHAYKDFTVFTKAFLKYHTVEVFGLFVFNFLPRI